MGQERFRLDKDVKGALSEHDLDLARMSFYFYPRPMPSIGGTRITPFSHFVHLCWANHLSEEAQADFHDDPMGDWSIAGLKAETAKREQRRRIEPAELQLRPIFNLPATRCYPPPFKAKAAYAYCAEMLTA